MGVVLYQGTFNPLSTTYARDLRQAWAGAFSGATGWDVLDANYVNGTSERSVIVNTVSGFALMIYNSTTTTDLTVRFAFGKSYDETTHTLSDLAFFNQISGLGVTNFTTNADAMTGTTFNPTAVSSSPNDVHTFKTVNATAGQTDWTVHISDEANTAIMTFKDGTDNIGKVIYIGEYDNLIGNPLISINEPYICSGVNLDSQRVAGQSFNLSIGLLESYDNPNTTLAAWRFSGRKIFLKQTSAPFDAAYNDLFSIDNDKSTVSPLYIAREAETPNVQANLYGWLIGKHKHVIIARSLNAAWGDTCTVDGKTYMLAGRNPQGVRDNGTGRTEDWLRETWWVEI
jgi:hypothetical protein